ncbi:MAG: GNAT family N-acetyltransferase [Verrucomicrobia bacterium]|nr:GNAT family N-acetyltransferase [Verrucomicrobiota bacterium]
MTLPLKILPLAPPHEFALTELIFELKISRAMYGLDEFRTQADVRKFAHFTYCTPARCLGFVAMLTDTDSLVGAAFIDSPDSLLSYMVSPAHWRQGIGTALVQAVVARCREQYRLPELRAIVSRENEPSRRLLEKLDFRLVGSQRIWLAPRFCENADLYAKVLASPIEAPWQRSGMAFGDEGANEGACARPVDAATE